MRQDRADDPGEDVTRPAHRHPRISAEDDTDRALRSGRQGRAGDLVSVLESGGQAVQQFVLLPDGTVAEQAIARRVNRSQGEAGLNGAEQVAAADRPRD